MLYHVTFYKNLESIAEHGLASGYGRSIGTQAYDSHRSGSLFLTDEEGVAYWIDKHEDWAHHYSDSPLEEGYIPVVLEIPEQYLRFCEEDELGSSDALSPAWKCSKNIPVDHIGVIWGDSVIHPSDWWEIDPAEAVDEGYYFKGEGPHRTAFTANPFASRAQAGECWRRQEPGWDCRKWARETDFTSLPQYAPNSLAHVRAGRRSGEARSERRDALLYEVEQYDPSLLPLAKKINWRIPAFPDRRSRFEWFLEYAHDNPQEIQDALMESTEATTRKLIRERIAEERGMQAHYAPADEAYDDEPYPSAYDPATAEIPDYSDTSLELDDIPFNNNPRSDRDIYEDWKKLVNMSARELRDFMASDLGKKAGLSKKKAEELGIGRGWDSAKAILRMKEKESPKRGGVPAKWDATDWSWARRQVSFIRRMSGNRGPLEDEKGRWTRKTLSLFIWGHNPFNR